MTKAPYKSNVPYTSFSKKRHDASPQPVQQTLFPVKEEVAVAEKPVPKTITLGSHVENTLNTKLLETAI